MEKEYFIGRDDTNYIDSRERVALFFQEVYEYPELCSDQQQAANLLQKINIRIEASAHNHNTKVRQKTQNYELSTREMDLPNVWFNKIAGFELFMRVTYTTKQYFLTGINGAIEIHQKIDGHSIFDKHHLYNDRNNKTLILKRPGSDFKDVWGNDLQAPVEEFSLRQNTFGYVKIKNQSSTT